MSGRFFYYGPETNLSIDSEGQWQSLKTLQEAGIAALAAYVVDQLETRVTLELPFKVLRKSAGGTVVEELLEFTVAKLTGGPEEQYEIRDHLGHIIANVGVGLLQMTLATAVIGLGGEIIFAVVAGFVINSIIDDLASTYEAIFGDVVEDVTLRFFTADGLSQPSGVFFSEGLSPLTREFAIQHFITHSAGDLNGGTLAFYEGDDHSPTGDTYVLRSFDVFADAAARLGLTEQDMLLAGPPGQTNSQLFARSAAGEGYVWHTTNSALFHIPIPGEALADALAIGSAFIVGDSGPPQRVYGNAGPGGPSSQYRLYLGAEGALSAQGDIMSKSIVIAAPSGQHLIGGMDSDYLIGAEGNDTLSGGGGADRLYGGGGNDVILAALDGDRAWGGAGTDSLSVTDGPPLQADIAGEDVEVYAQSGGMTLIGEEIETLILGWGDDRIDVGAITGGDLALILAAGGNDVITIAGGGGLATVRINGGDGMDRFVVQGGRDLELVGGDGEDIFDIATGAIVRIAIAEPDARDRLLIDGVEVRGTAMASAADPNLYRLGSLDLVRAPDGTILVGGVRIRNFDDGDFGIRLGHPIPEEGADVVAMPQSLMGLVTPLSGGGFGLSYFTGRLGFRTFEDGGAPTDVVAEMTRSPVIGDAGSAAVAQAAGGGFVAAWWDNANAWIVKAQRLDAGGGLIGAPVVLSTSTQPNATPSVVTLADGRVLVAWLEEVGGFSPDQIRGSFFDPATGQFGAPVVLASDSNDNARYLSAKPLAGGGFVVTWTSEEDGTLDDNIYARVLGGNGQPLSAAFRVNQNTFSGQAFSDVAAVGNGFVITWADAGASQGSGLSVRAALFGASGNRLGNDFTVNTTGLAFNSPPQVAPVEGVGFVVIWVNKVFVAPANGGIPEVYSNDIVGQLFDFAGHKLGTEFVVNSTTDMSEMMPDVAPLEGGGFVVSWQAFDSANPSNDRSGVWTRQYDGAGQPVTPGIRVQGGQHDDFLEGGGGRDHLAGGGGNDRFDGGAGGDAIDGGDGSDTITYAFSPGPVFVNLATRQLSGGWTTGDVLTSVEIVEGSAFADRLTGTGLADTLRGLGGNDIIDGGLGADVMAGGGEDDYYYVDNGGDRVLETAGQGSDRIFAGISYALVAGASVETLTTTNNAGTAAINFTGNELANTIYGNDGANSLNGGGGADILVGRLGDDFYFVDHVGDRLLESAGQGSDRVFASISYTLGAGVSVETFTTSLNSGTATLNLTGNELANTIYGNDGANILDGKAGADILVGRLGDDWFYVDNAADRILESAGQGNDRLFATASYALAAGVSVEMLTTASNTGTGAITLIGNELANIVYGNDGANSLDGGGGADTLVGRLGDDFYFVDHAADRVLESAGEGSDRLYAGASYTLAAGASVEIVNTIANAGTAAIALTGNALAQTIVGNMGANSLDGGGGGDTMVGLGGDDFYYVRTAGDRAVEAAGGGTDRVFAALSFTLEAGSAVEVLSTIANGATTALNLAGNELANTLYGNAGINILDGKAGADTLVGMAGADSFAFTTGLGATNVDRIVDFSSVDDNIRLDDAVFAGIGPLGALNPNAFALGTAAADLNDRIVYNQATGQLFFDADGSGAAKAAVLFATLQGAPVLNAGDFVVI